MTIPFFNYPALFRTREEQILSKLTEVMRSGKFILQEDLSTFETNFAEYLGCKHALGTGSGTDAIFLGLKAYDVGAGDEVILPSHTFVATAAAVVACGATPVLVDVRDDHLMDPDAVESAITAKTRALIPVQLNGRTCEMDAIMDIATRHDLLVQEDAAQALGSEFTGRKAGTFGVTGSFSFYPAKLLGCFGDGGGIVTNDDSTAERLSSLRDHGRMADGDVRGWSYNTRLDNLQAALLDYKLTYFEAELGKRRQIAATYDRALSKYEELLLPPPPTTVGDYFDVYQNYELEYPNRDSLREHLSNDGIGTIIQWGGRAVHQFENLEFDIKLPVTERIMERSLLLPLHTALTDGNVETICSSIDIFFEQQARS